MPARLSALSLFLLFLLGLSACPPVGTPGDDDDATSMDDDDDSSSDDDDDATTPPPPEDCFDGIDNDLDTLVDCDDPECADVPQCVWPRELIHSGSFDYKASLLAELGGYSDCLTEFTAALVEETDVATQCPTCDRTFSGPMSYPFDDCPAGDEPRPSSVSYGLVFFNELQWEVFVQDAELVWTSVGFAAQAGDSYTLVRSDEVDYDGTDAGDIETTLTFTPPTDD